MDYKSLESVTKMIEAYQKKFQEKQEDNPTESIIAPEALAIATTFGCMVE